ncbi:MAG: aminotransferase class I/II-fold pyridoxal phosphate-dependent enzyme [Clostridia bacterium]|nr:aminotransferase class I/II-fold pyridoxal phosphate-dependent enzyme [Clostridia bacterium]
MRGFFSNRSVAKRCHILGMLKQQRKGVHRSYHTPGHKRRGYDITELSYSDNLSCPRGVIALAESDIATILGAESSFILTDGSTAGVLSMLLALKEHGCRRIAAPIESHKSFFNGCALLGLTPVLFETPASALPCALTVDDVAKSLENADALFLTSPDYYGNVADLKEISMLCKRAGKPLVIDGAHGGHLHFNQDLYAGNYADLWVDGVHKSLPALTQGAVVSARKNGGFSESLKRAVGTFRTTSPSYPIMASVEYAVKSPQNKDLEAFVLALKKADERLYAGQDYTKLCVFSSDGFALQKFAETKGLYPEFSEANTLCFYLSPTQNKSDVKRILKFLNQAERQGLLIKEKDVHRIPAPAELQNIEGLETENVPFEESEGRIAARVCGLFPPCLPLLRKGERITKEKIDALKNAPNRFGVDDDKITVVKR